MGGPAHVHVEGFTCVSRGLRAHSGVNVRTRNVAVGSLPPWPGARQCAPRYARNHSGQAPDNVREQPIPPGTAQNAGYFATSSPFSVFFTEVVCGVGAIPPRTAVAPPPNGGIALHGGPTRRRHAARRLLVVQNPHRSQPEVRRIAYKSWAQHRLARKISPNIAPPVAFPRKYSPGTAPPAALPRKSSPSTRKNAEFGPI